ncbi:MAG: hypothetical protein WB803_04600, partial [Pseudolabrys sp.]
PFQSSMRAMMRVISGTDLTGLSLHPGSYPQHDPPHWPAAGALGRSAVLSCLAPFAAERAP